MVEHEEPPDGLLVASASVLDENLRLC